MIAMIVHLQQIFILFTVSFYFIGTL